MGKKYIFAVLMMMAMIFAGLVRGAGKEFMMKTGDLNYRYQVNFSGRVIDFTDPALNLDESKTTPKKGTERKIPRKVLIELMIESIYGGFEWLPINPVISDGANHIYSNYKVIVAPQSGDSSISVKYLISGVAPETNSLTFYEEGLSQDGKKAYRLSIRNIPVE